MKNTFITMAALALLLSTQACKKDNKTNAPAPQPGTEQPGTQQPGTGQPAPQINYQTVNLPVAAKQHIEFNLDGDEDYDFSFTSIQETINNKQYLYLVINSMDLPAAQMLVQKDEDPTFGGLWADPLTQETSVNATAPASLRWNTEVNSGYLFKMISNDLQKTYTGPLDRQAAHLCGNQV